MNNVQFSVETKMVLTLLQQFEKEIFKEVRNVVNKWSMIVETKAKDKAPTDVGRLKASINQALYLYASEIVGVVGTNLFYAFYQHEGFKAHWVPFYNPPTWDAKSGVRNYSMLQWARRHGFPVDGIKGANGKYIKQPMKGMWVRGIPNPYILEAFEDCAIGFEREINQVVEKVVNKLNGDK